MIDQQASSIEKSKKSPPTDDLLTVADYQTDTNNVWCPGCGDFGVLSSLHMALAELQVPPQDLILVTGIGCSSRMAGYVNAYGFNSVHGRSLPIATGAKLAKPESTVIAAGGDGDGFSIGAGHLPHTARRNIDISYIVMDNGIYGLTKGQMSPTTPLGVVTKTSLDGTFDVPMNPLLLMMTYNASFIAQTFAGNPKHQRDVFIKAIEHKGFAFVNAISPCPTFRGPEQFKENREAIKYLDVEEPDYDCTDRVAALTKATDPDNIWCGIYYAVERPTFWDQQLRMREHMLSKGDYDVADIMDTHFMAS